MHTVTTAVTTLRRTCLTIAHGVCLLFALAASAAAQPDDPFARRAWHVEFQAHRAVETWNYNISHEEMFGGFVGATYAVRDGLTLTAGDRPYSRGLVAVLVIGLTRRTPRRPSSSPCCAR